VTQRREASNVKTARGTFQFLHQLEDCVGTAESKTALAGQDVL